MRGAELVCLPSKSESFGLVMIEALAAGAPVVGFGPTLREIRDRVGIDVGEPLDDPTPENVAAAIESVRSRSWDPEGLRKAALSEFSAESVARRYAKLLRDSDSKLDRPRLGVVPVPGDRPLQALLERQLRLPAEALAQLRRVDVLAVDLALGVPGPADLRLDPGARQPRDRPRRSRAPNRDAARRR